MYSVKLTHPARKALRRLPKSVLDLLWNTYLIILRSNPFAGEKLRGELKDFYKLEFTQAGVSYRVAYQVFLKERIILIIYLGTRENFYRELKRKLK